LALRRLSAHPDFQSNARDEIERQSAMAVRIILGLEKDTRPARMGTHFR